ncbi:MAG: FAD-dependent oxidoreductase [Christensenellales bacterium]|jgi:glycine/D-amino acid oxidase-like deaminating enzyme/nitrite reductase/ring-hydroxylating ferredoxin subunit
MESIWMKEVQIPPRPQLEGDLRADVCVIGAGLAGVNCAYRLAQAGLRVVVLEAARIGAGTTARTTAKITAQHDLIYDALARSFDADTARIYAKANTDAIEDYAQIIDREGIDCNFARADHLVYALRDASALESEHRAMRDAGLNAYLTDRTELPFSVAGAVGLRDQAHIHPLKFLGALAEKLEIYEQSRAIDVGKGIVCTPGGSVRAAHIVVATRFPFINAPGYYFLRMHQERSYAAALTGAPAIKHMYIDMADGGLSIRPYAGMMILGAGSHRTGENPGGQYEKLSRAMGAHFPGAQAAATWSAQDCVTQDRLPLIGRYAGRTDELYVLTGFAKWGLTTAMAGAKVVEDLILGRESDAARIFAPARSIVKGAKGMADDIKASVKGFAKRILPPEGLLNDLAPGEAREIAHAGEKLGAYRDEAGQVHIVSLVCPHLGCALSWNADDLSWDCPCHGSRFDIRGALLDGPSQRGIDKEDAT